MTASLETSSQTPKKKMSPLVLFLLVVGGGTVCFCCTGIGAAVAIPGFVNYVKRSKTSEAHANVTLLTRAVRRVCRTDDHAPITTQSLPSGPSEVKQFGDFAHDEGFVKLEFDPGVPLYYSYAVQTEADGTYVISAEGDLDSDGIRSRFEVRCTHACRCGEMTSANELE